MTMRREQFPKVVNRMADVKTKKKNPVIDSVEKAFDKTEEVPSEGHTKVDEPTKTWGQKIGEGLARKKKAMGK